MLYKLIFWILDKKLNNSNVKKKITQLYRRIAVADLAIHLSVVRVKKGKRRYSVLILDTPDGKHKIWISKYSLRTEYLSYKQQIQ